ncbi:hypothetical protein D3C80_1709610 [compost metagenome]
MYLVECFANGNAALFQLNLHERQAVYQNGHVVAIGMCAGLLKLFDHLHFVAGNVLFVEQVDVLDMSVVKDEIVDVVVVNFARFISDTVAGSVQIGFQEPHPLTILKAYIVQGLQLLTGICQERFRRVELY